MSLRPAAMFVDFENIYYFIRNTADVTDEDASDATLKTLTELVEDSRINRGHEIVFSRAYLDMDRVHVEAKRLSFLGIKAEHVTSTPQKSSTDIALSLDLLEFIFVQKNIDTIYIVGGDRDYLQICRRLRESLKEYYVAGFERSLSGELREFVGDKRVVLCDRFVSELSYFPRSMGRPAASPNSTVATSATAPVSISMALSVNTAAPATVRRPAIDVPPPVKSGPFDPEGENPWEERALTAIVRFMQAKNVEEVWLRPFLNNLDHDEQFAALSAAQRRAVVNRLNSIGAVELEKRRGNTTDYSVLHLKREHPLVQKVAARTRLDPPAALEPAVPLPDVSAEPLPDSPAESIQDNGSALTDVAPQTVVASSNELKPEP